MLRGRCVMRRIAGACCGFVVVSAQAQPSFTGLGVLPGGAYSAAYAVSGSGLVAVGESGPIGAPHAFRWAAGGGMIDLGVLTGDPTSSAKGVSADGSVVVGVSGAHAFRWTAAGGMVNLGVLPGGTSAEAT